MGDERKPYVPADQHGQPDSAANEDSEANQPETTPDEFTSLDSAPESENARPAVDEFEPDIERLGYHLARALQEGAYHPVILFGTNFSGKTSLLLSLLTTLIAEPRFNTGIALCDPILGTRTGTGRELHNEARKLFEVKTQAFLEGEQIPASTIRLPFFVPVEVRPEGKPAMRFAFLESNGEWYRPERKAGRPLVGAENLYKELKKEIEQFVASYQGGITFIYLTPYTQQYLDVQQDDVTDAHEIESASLAVAGVIRTYDRIRANHRSNDCHLMLVTKWDARSLRDSDRFEGMQEDREALNVFASTKYAQALGAFKGLKRGSEHCYLNAYCSGLINERGLLQLRHDDDVRDIVISYPIRLWSWLYKNALVAADYPIEPLFPEPPQPMALVRFWNRLLDFISGR